MLDSARNQKRAREESTDGETDTTVVSSQPDCRKSSLHKKSSTQGTLPQSSGQSSQKQYNDMIRSIVVASTSDDVQKVIAAAIEKVDYIPQRDLALKHDIATNQDMFTGTREELVDKLAWMRLALKTLAVRQAATNAGLLGPDAKASGVEYEQIEAQMGIICGDGATPSEVMNRLKKFSRGNELGLGMSEGQVLRVGCKVWANLWAHRGEKVQGFIEGVEALLVASEEDLDVEE